MELPFLTLAWTCSTVLAQPWYRGATISPVCCFNEIRKGWKLKGRFVKEVLPLATLMLIGLLNDYFNFYFWLLSALPQRKHESHPYKAYKQLMHEVCKKDYKCCHSAGWPLSY